MGANGDQDYTFRMRNILFLILLLITTPVLFAEDIPVRAFMKIQGTNQLLSENHGQIPSVAGNDQVKATLEQLKDGDEVIVEGRVRHEVISYGDFHKIHSFLVIDQLHKVSLAELGNILYQVPESQYSAAPISRSYSPSAIPVTAEVASAMTMTTGLMLAESLSGSASTDPEGRRQIRQSIFLSAGLMATIIFIYEQISGSSHP